MLKIYFKSTCSTCKNALNLIKENTDEDYELIEYMVETPTQKELKEILKMLGLKAFDLVRQKEQLYKTKFANKKLTNAEWIKVLAENPILIERPVVVKDGKAIIGRPIERILEIL
jgi:arsenate reductase